MSKKHSESMEAIAETALLACDVSDSIQELKERFECQSEYEAVRLSLWLMNELTRMVELSGWDCELKVASDFFPHSHRGARFRKEDNVPVLVEIYGNDK